MGSTGTATRTVSHEILWRLNIDDKHQHNIGSEEAVRRGKTLGLDLKGKIGNVHTNPTALTSTCIHNLICQEISVS